ncbi:MAG: sensor histidine kinase, partial [Lachnospiraceae bacterium]
LWQDIFSRVSSRELIGIVDITRDGNPMIIDATNRQDFVDNQEYRDLKEFIILQLSALQDYKVYSRKEKRKENNNSLENAGDSIQSFISTIETISQKNPELKKHLSPAIEQAKKTGAVVKQAITEQKQTQEEFTRKENIYLSIMSMQEYAIHITHAVRTTLNKIRDKVEYFNLFFPNPEEEEIFTKYAHDMYDEFKTLNKVIDYMLSYSQANLLLEEVDFSLTVKEIFSSYSSIFSAQGINAELSIPGKIVLKDTNKVFFRDILNNLIDNSIKAVRNTSSKIIKCSVSVDQDNLQINVSDTGCGIPVEKRNWVFGIYNTTTEEDGGAGIGLYIVKTRVESLKGSVKVIDSEFGNIGSTIRVELPFKR